MIELPSQLERMISFYSKLPGVGRKTALRQALVMTKWMPEDIQSFGNSIKELTKLNECVSCGLFAENEFCNICLSEKRKESGVICIVEQFTDAMAIEQSETYQGLYHVLGGVLNPLLGVGPQELKIPDLIKRILESKILEIVLAINPSVEGDATCSYIFEELKNINVQVKVQRIGFGMPMGGSFEHLDSLTISKAFENKRDL